MIVQDIFIVCSTSMVFDPKSGQMSHYLTDIFTGLPVILTPEQYQIVLNAMKVCTDKGHYPSTICIQGHFLHDSEVIYVTTMFLVMVLNQRVTTMYLEIQNGEAYFIDEKTGIKVEVNGLPEADLKRFQSELATLTIQGNDFSKEGYDRISVLGNIEKIGDSIVYTYDRSFIMQVTSCLVNTLFNSIQRSNYDH